MVISVKSTGIGGLVDKFMWGVITPQWCRCSFGGDMKIMGGDGAIFPKMGGDHPPSPPTTKNPGMCVSVCACVCARLWMCVCVCVCMQVHQRV